MISKIFESQIGDVNIGQLGTNEIVIAKTVEILNDLSKDKKEIKELSNKIKDDLNFGFAGSVFRGFKEKV